MCYHTIIASLLLLFFCDISAGFDDPASSLDKLPRTIKKQPNYLGKPGYLLLVFGDDLKQCRWLVVDGKTAYFDRNGNGDLTDPEDRIEADKEKSDQDEAYFNLGEVAVGGVKHHKLAFTLTSPDQLTHLEDAPVVTGAALKAKVLKLWGEFEIPGYTGRCAYGRVPRTVGPFDNEGYLFLENDSAQARIVHFGNKWSVQLDGWQKLFQGTEKDIILNVGSRGWGTGTFAKLGYEKVIPEDQHPRITLMFPNAGGSGLHEHKQTLKERC
ncbi:MAG TPA: hypothetical protein PLN21_08275 [Gemmatales bacterium]|nr:hypothetical protein [Gemmatales bacterium]